MELCLLLLLWVATVRGTVEVVETDVCVAPFPAMPVLKESETVTNANGRMCHECELNSVNPVIDNTTCPTTRCTGNGGNLTCYTWHLKYKDADESHLRTGCAVKCDVGWIEYERHMCSGVGDKLYEWCKFTMCDSDICNRGHCAGVSTLVMVLLTTMLFMQY